MSQSPEKQPVRGKRSGGATLFFLLFAASFGLILIFNLLTPMFSDDFSYGNQVRSASSFLDLIAQEKNQYMTWSGRSVVHIILRIFLSLPGIIFKAANSAAFMLLSVLIFPNVRTNVRTSDGQGEMISLSGWRGWFFFLLVQLGLWLFAVDFEQSVLWETGACNYLWGTTIILLFMTLSEKLRGSAGIPGAILLFVLGIAAGWCNENTSGGSFLFLLILLIEGRIRKEKLTATLPAALLGNDIGLFMMVRAPGNAVRAAFKEEIHSELYGMIARFQKLTLNMREYFLPLLVILAVRVILYCLQSRRKTVSEILYGLRRVILFTFLFFATCYALILTVSAQPRAMSGAGIFLLIAVLQAVMLCLDAEEAEDSSILARALCFGGAAALTISMFFTVLECGAHNARISRDIRERIRYIEEKKAQGEDDITVAQVHTDFYNPYSVAEDMELSEDPAYWANVSYEEYFGVSSIRAIPYDDWRVIK